jgi:hypothetical protein
MSGGAQSITGLFPSAWSSAAMRPTDATVVGTSIPADE